ncbi:MAG: methyltransferase domain-containing protein [Spirochaetes bacterium]|nr:methyltransferase domain-containing protein [Spirochaetota bacterium]
MTHDPVEKIRYFDGLAPQWDETVGNDGARRERLREILGSIRIDAGDRVLDVGCGNGVLFRLIEERIGPGGSICALDPSPMMVARARELHPEFGNIRYITGLLEDADLPAGHFDRILCFAVIPHLEDLPRSLSVLRRAIAPRGTLYIFHLESTENLNAFHAGLDAPVKHDMLPAEDELKGLLADNGFSVGTYIDRPGLNFVECRPCPQC